MQNGPNFVWRVSDMLSVVEYGDFQPPIVAVNPVLIEEQASIQVEDATPQPCSLAVLVRLKGNDKSPVRDSRVASYV